MKRIAFSLLCLLLAGCTLLLSSCEIQIQATELSANYTRSTDDPGEMTDTYRTASLTFAFELFRETMPASDANSLLSPYSALLCLGLIANGTAGTTRQEIESTLGMTVEELNRGLYAFGESLYSGKNCEVSTANSAWYIDDPGFITVHPAFLQTIADWYDAEQYAAPFDASTVEDLNNWGKDKTDGLIKKFLDTISPDTVMYLINTLLFDAKWEEPYEKKDIRDLTFHNADGSETTVDMLCSTEGSYMEGDGFTGFAKLYEGKRYAFVGLLPEEGTSVTELAALLNGETWSTVWKGRGGTVYAKFPEFSYDRRIDLKAAIAAMGMPEMFEDGADFSALGVSELYTGFHCSEMEQISYIEVSRNGTKAAAISWGGIKGDSAADPFEPKYVTLDRPFLYAIVDVETGFPLFLGTVSQL